MLKKIFFFLFFSVIISCAPIENFKNTFITPSPRLSYERELKDDEPTLKAWQSAHENALLTPRTITLPHGGQGIFKTAVYTVYSYQFSLQIGEILEAEVLTDSVDQKVFLTLFNTNNLSKPVEDNLKDEKQLRFSISESGNYVLSVQPEVALNSICTIVINKKPKYQFPVAGKGNAAIQSFWDAPRDNGERRHEGIDIFAEKGTPVVAVTDGLVYEVADRGLGGKQVWQRDGNSGNAIYYAHLNDIVAKSGTTVRTGDTLGYVGNTGNAKGGPAHLHFGIYDGWKGALNPLPFVYQTKRLLIQDFLKAKTPSKAKK